MAYKGLSAPIPCGEGGLNLNENVFQIPIQQLKACRNVVFDGDTWRKVGGAETFDANAISGTPTLRAATDWHPDATTQRIVSAWSNGSVYKEVTGDVDNVTLASGLTFSSWVQFVEGGQESAGRNRKLFMFSKGNAPRVLAADGVSMSTLATPSADWSGANQPTMGTIHAYRLAVAGNENAPHAVYLSRITDHEDFVTNSVIVEVYPGEGERIAALFSMNPNALFVFKYPRGIYYIDTSDLTLSVVPVIKVRDDVGMSGPLGVARRGDDAWFMSSVGTVHTLRSSLAAEKVQDTSVSALQNLESLARDSMQLSRLDRCVAVYDELRQEISFGYTAPDDSGGTVNGHRLVFDASRPDRFRPTVVDLGVDLASPVYLSEALFMYRESSGQLRLYGGGTGGLIYKLNRANRSIASTNAYTGEFWTPDTDLSYVLGSDPAKYEKRWDWFEITIVPTGAYSLSVDVYIDGRYSETLSIGLGSGGSALDSLTDTLSPADPGETDFRLGGADITNHKVRLHGRGRRISFRCYNSGVNQDFSIAEIMVHFKVQGFQGGE